MPDLVLDELNRVEGCAHPYMCMIGHYLLTHGYSVHLSGITAEHKCIWLSDAFLSMQRQLIAKKLKRVLQPLIYK